MGDGRAMARQKKKKKKQNDEEHVHCKWEI